MKITYEGQVYDFDLMKIPTEELREIKRKLGLTVRQFLQGVSESDVDAMSALRWCILRSDGQHDDLLLVQNDPFPDYWAFTQAWVEGQVEDEEEEADPTQAGTLPATSIPESSGSSAPTSTSSVSNTASPSPDGAESANGRSDGSLSEPSAATSAA